MDNSRENDLICIACDSQPIDIQEFCNDCYVDMLPEPKVDYQFLGISAWDNDIDEEEMPF